MMNIRPFAPDDYPAMIEIHDCLNIAWPEQPRTPEAWAKVDHNRDPHSNHRRWIAEVAGQVIGFASCSQPSWGYPPQSFSIDVEVHPAFQRRGIGSALYEQILDEVQKFHPPALRADAFTNLPQGFAFLQKRGFFEAFRETPVYLDVSTFDPSPYAGLEPKLNAAGIFIRTLAGLRSEPGYDHKLYELYTTVEQDVPHEGDTVEKPAFDDWARWTLHDPSILPDAYLVAVCGGDFVGLRELGRYDQDSLLGGLLGVRREYRKRGIAQAMYVRNIIYAREHGYRLLKDCTAVQNAPMQALFNQLSFRRSPEWLQCQKDLLPET